VRFAVRRPTQRSASPRSHGMPCRDISSCVDVGMIHMTAGNAFEDRLALTVLRCDTAAFVAPLRGIGGADHLDPPRRLVLEALYQLAPTARKDSPVQTGLAANARSRLFVGTSRRPCHLRDPQVLHSDQIEPSGECCSRLLYPVVSSVDSPSDQPGDGVIRPTPSVRAGLGPSQPPLQKRKPSDLLRTRLGRLEEFTCGKCRRHPHATIDTDDCIVPRRGDDGRDCGEGNMPPPGSVKGDSVRLGSWGLSTPSELDPADLRHAYGARIPAQTFDMMRAQRDDPESLGPSRFPPGRSTMCPLEVVGKGLAEVPQCLLLNHLWPLSEPVTGCTRLCQLASLLKVSRGCLTIWPPIAVLFDGQVPYETCVSTELEQPDRLRRRRRKAESGHIRNCRIERRQFRVRRLSSAFGDVESESQRISVLYE